MTTDLHCHTTASDGTLSPTQLVEAAQHKGLDGIGVTDHDTVEGLREATAAGASMGIAIVPGIELSTKHEGRSVHILGFFVDANVAGLREALDGLRLERLDRARRMVGRLNELGYTITMDDVTAQARGAIIARPHVARALVAKGLVETLVDAFSPALIGDGGRAEVPRTVMSPAEGLDLIRRAGAAPVLAHPGVAHHAGATDPVPEALIADLAGRGLVGLEVDHPEHSEEIRERLRSIGERLGLLSTGGSDYHGPGGRPLGTCTTGADVIDELRRRAG